MSIPEAEKKTSNHQVVKVTYDTQSMHKLMVFSIVLSILLIGSVCFMACMIRIQTQQINTLSIMVNELNYKVEQQALNIQQSRGQVIKRSDNEEFLEHLAASLDEIQQDTRKIKFQISRAEDQIKGQQTELKALTLMVKQQSKSSWEMKEVIEAIKSKLEYVSTIIEGIPEMFKNIPNPDFTSMKDKIKGTFENIKESMGSMFDSGDQGSEAAKGKKKDEGMFDGMRDRFQRGWRAYSRQPTKQTEM